MTDKTTLLRLADAAAKATGPDIDLDIEISDACNMATPHGLPTASLDAAMTLMPRGTWWSVGVDEDGESGVCPFETQGEPGAWVFAATPALALCAAALRARSRAITEGE